MQGLITSDLLAYTEEYYIRACSRMDALLFTDPQVVGLALFGNEHEDTARNAKWKIQRPPLRNSSAARRTIMPLQFIWDCDSCLHQVKRSGAANAGMMPQPIELL